jgi:hypothetical protein
VKDEAYCKSSSNENLESVLYVVFELEFSEPPLVIGVVPVSRNPLVLLYPDPDLYRL